MVSQGEIRAENARSKRFRTIKDDNQSVMFLQNNLQLIPLLCHSFTNACVENEIDAIVQMKQGQHVYCNHFCCLLKVP